MAFSNTLRPSSYTACQGKSVAWIHKRKSYATFLSSCSLYIALKMHCMVHEVDTLNISTLICQLTRVKSGHVDVFIMRKSPKTCVYVQACEKDSQCGGGMCCAVSLWIRNLRMCIPMGQMGEDCHPMSHKVNFLTFLLTFVMIFVCFCFFFNLSFLFRRLFLGRDSIIHAHVCPTQPASPQLMASPNVSRHFLSRINTCDEDVCIKCIVAKVFQIYLFY